MKLLNISPSHVCSSDGATPSDSFTNAPNWMGAPGTIERSQKLTVFTPTRKPRISGGVSQAGHAVAPILGRS